MHQMVRTSADQSWRWLVLAIVVAAQFMFGVDAFIVNVALPTIANDLNASPAQVEAVIAIYLIGYGTLVVTGGRLGDIHGTKQVFIAGVFGFSVTSLWCGLTQSGPELIIARLAQGATAALMVPQVLATIHVLFNDEARARAFAIYGIVLGLAGAAGFALGGVLVGLNLAGFGWRAVFFVNIPAGIVIILAALRWMPAPPARQNTRLDIPGAITLFVALLCLIGPLLFGHDVGWSPAVWLVMIAGVGVMAAFLRLERRLAARGGIPLIDLVLLKDDVFMRGLAAVFLFFFANLSFYLVVTLYLQADLKVAPLHAGLVFLPLAIAFVIASRHSAVRAKAKGTRVLIEGCAVQITALAALFLLTTAVSTPSVGLLTAALIVFGYGQGLVMAPLSGVVLASVPAASAGAGSGIYGTTTQIANAAGVAAIGALQAAVQIAVSGRAAFAASLIACAISIALCGACLAWMRRG